MPKALVHTYPTWETDRDHGDGEPREVWFGYMHIVSPRRARKLRKRGVPLMPLHAVRLPDDVSLGRPRYEPTTPDGRARYAWFEVQADADKRRAHRALRCYIRASLAENTNTLGRKNKLRLGLALQRDAHLDTLQLREETRWQRKNLYSGTIHENLLQTGFAEIEARMVAAGYVPLGDGPLSDEWGTPDMLHELKVGPGERATDPNAQGDLYARAFQTMQIETATGARLDALCKLLPYDTLVLRKDDETDADFRTRALQELQGQSRRYVLTMPTVLGDKPLEGFAASDAFEYDPTAHDERPKP